jgi:hypothetical protein
MFWQSRPIWGQLLIAHRVVHSPSLRRSPVIPALPFPLLSFPPRGLLFNPRGVFPEYLFSIRGALLGGAFGVGGNPSFYLVGCTTFAY